MINEKEIYEFISSKSLEAFGFYNKGIMITLRDSFFENLDCDVWLPSKQMNLQRGFVWSTEQKQLFILSKIIGNYIAPVTLIRQEIVGGKESYQVIDGKQRLSAIKEFKENLFSITINDKEVFYRDNELFFNKLSGVSHITANVFYEYADNIYSDDTKIAMFENCSFLGTPQDLNHLVNLKTRTNYENSSNPNH